MFTNSSLLKKAVAVFGQAAINQWPTPIDYMDLNQLAAYFEAEAKTDNLWETVEHDGMVDNRLFRNLVLLTIKSLARTFK